MFRVYPLLLERLCAMFAQADSSFDPHRLSLDCKQSGFHAAYFAGNSAQPLTDALVSSDFDAVRAQNGYVNIAFSSQALIAFLPAFCASLPAASFDCAIAEDEFFAPIYYAAARLHMFAEISTAAKHCAHGSAVRDALYRLYGLAEPLECKKLSTKAISVGQSLCALYDGIETDRANRMAELRAIAQAGSCALFAVHHGLKNTGEGESL